MVTEFSNSTQRILEENAELWQALADLDTHTSNTDSPHIDFDWVQRAPEAEDGLSDSERERRRLMALTDRERDAAVWIMLQPHCGEVNLLLCRYVDGDVQPYAGYPTGHISPPHYTDAEATAAIDNWVKRVEAT